MATTRKSALTIAGVVAGSLALGSVAGAAGSGLFSSSSPDPQQVQLEQVSDTSVPEPTTTPTTAGIEVVYQDVYDLPPADSGGSAPAPVTASAAVDASGAATVGDDSYEDESHEAYEDDDAYEQDDSYEDESHESGEHESGEHESDHDEFEVEDD